MKISKDGIFRIKALKGWCEGQYMTNGLGFSKNGKAYITLGTMHSKFGNFIASKYSDKEFKNRCVDCDLVLINEVTREQVPALDYYIWYKANKYQANNNLEFPQEKQGVNYDGI